MTQPYGGVMGEVVNKLLGTGLNWDPSLIGQGHRDQAIIVDSKANRMSLSALSSLCCKAKYTQLLRIVSTTRWGRNLGFGALCSQLIINFLTWLEIGSHAEQST